MKVEALLNILEERGLRPVLVEGRLILRGPRTSWTPALVRVLILHHAKLLRHFDLPADAQPIDRLRWPWTLANSEEGDAEVKSLFPPDSILSLYKE